MISVLFLIHCHYSKINFSLPDAHINLELWQPPGFNIEAWVNKGYVLDCGPLGPIARRGIFTSSDGVETVFRTNNVGNWLMFLITHFIWHYNIHFHPSINSSIDFKLNLNYPCQSNQSFIILFTFINFKMLDIKWIFPINQSIFIINLILNHTF